MNLFCAVFAAFCLVFRASQITPAPTVTPTPTPVPIAWPARIPILLYHYVEYVEDKGDTIRQSLNITPYTFDKQLQTLVDAGYTFLTAKDLGELFDGKITKLPEKSVLITFDDGYRDFYTDVYPILQKYNAKATVYVIAGFVYHRNYMTEAQLKEIAASGLVDVGAHTVHHVGLTNADKKTEKKEVEESKKILEDILGTSVVSFAYPDGSYDDYAIQAVRDAGFTTAVSTKPGIENGIINRYALFRLRSGGRIGETLLQYFNQKTFKSW
ncbi:MAG: polysaccharide deacetylase family protein [Microgenomates group bacterium]